jgi:hypothetical protein
MGLENSIFDSSNGLLKVDEDIGFKPKKTKKFNKKFVLVGLLLILIIFGLFLFFWNSDSFFDINSIEKPSTSDEIDEEVNIEIESENFEIFENTILEVNNIIKNLESNEEIMIAIQDTSFFEMNIDEEHI